MVAFILRNQMQAIQPVPVILVNKVVDGKEYIIGKRPGGVAQCTSQLLQKQMTRGSSPTRDRCYDF
jgi:hypothetical protein